METMIGIYDAKRSLSALFEKVAAGERFLIPNRGEPVAMLVPIEEARSGQTADDAGPQARWRTIRKHPSWWRHVREGLAY